MRTSKKHVNTDLALRDQLVQEHMLFARKIAAFLVRVGKTRHLSYPEAESAAYYGLVESANCYDRTRGVDFKRHAYRRIHGAVLDENRRQSLIAVPDYWHTINGNKHLSECDPGWRDLYERLTTPTTFSPQARGSRRRPPSRRDDSVDVEAVSLALRRLPAREREVIRLYYFEGHIDSEIAQQIGVTKQRAQQIRQAALTKLRPLLQEQRCA